MADPHPAALSKIGSPISQVLSTLGLTREDLLRHSDQMRQFLTAEDANSLRVLTREIANSGVSAVTSTRARSSSLLNASGSTHQRDSSLPATPATPIKAEPSEHTLPRQHSHRTMDNMEMIMERKSRQSKRDKKERRDRTAIPPVPLSPSPNKAGFNVDTYIHSGTSRRVPTSGEPDAVATKLEETDMLPAEPITPQKRRYYRDHTDSTARTRQDPLTGTSHPDSPTPVRHRARLPTPAQPTPTQLTTSRAHTFAIPSTPVRMNQYYRSPLPASSPPPPSSPFSSPTKGSGSSVWANLVSSPGPQLPLPSESDYDMLPYTLPPGPYSTKKPDASYAALVGRAVLSSPGHALTLQEIYDWITIVHPYFKRGETTWMNSIRHVLSTTACFRKQTRARAVGRTLWAIWGEDLECFKNGGFRKQFCADLMEGKKAAAAAGRKRPATEGEGSERKNKRQKRQPVSMEGAEIAEAVPATYQSIMPPLVPTSQLRPLFPSTRPSSVHQPYYESYMHTIPPAPEVIFPPLPPTNYEPSDSGSTSASASASASASLASVPPSSAYGSRRPSLSPPSPSSASGSGSISMPELTPNGSSSSPIIPSSEGEIESIEIDVAVREASPELMYPPAEMDEDSDDRLFSEMLSADALEPGFMLNKHDYYHSLDKGKRRAMTPPKRAPPLPVQLSPSLGRKNKVKSNKSAAGESRMTFPSPPLRPSTPPRNASSSYLQLSPQRTPLSHRGVHMSPSASLAHYKSHLDPPPPSTSLSLSTSSLDADRDSTDILRTPSRSSHKRPITSAERTQMFPSFPVTPKRLFSASLPQSGSQDSPFRTPLAGTARHGHIFDPHDPGALLDDELSRLGALGAQDSPLGLYEGRKGLLYESPGMPSPGKFAKWW
ncbi:hypothetical protein FIBSPDRAFT_1047397 [Athelia psychrophila]|uniref:Fork-head domain-containing protein n=1 Tax=Athelia psychrophila TaxID=1759441 RepID=A0A166FAH2_9AGAM|nr:hypothetical protein FIBSPDRAFT_1047397 [Fibularhizoctonia sp. CBS 109695]